MDLKQIVLLALQVSIMFTVFGFGLNATVGDLLYVVRRPGLLARSLLAVWVVMPAIAVGLVLAFHFRPEVEIVLIALAISPVPPLLPTKEVKAGGHSDFGVGLMAILCLLSIVAVPLALELLERVTGHPLGMAPGAVAALVVKAALAPLLAGMVFRAALPAIAGRIAKPMALVAKVLLLVAAVPLLIVAMPAIGAEIGGLTVAAMVIFVVAGLAIGHLLGGPDPDHSMVLALSAACRHPAIALAIAAANFPNLRFGAIILLYVLVNGVAAIPYLTWQKRRKQQGLVA